MTDYGKFTKSEDVTNPCRSSVDVTPSRSFADLPQVRRSRFTATRVSKAILQLLLLQITFVLFSAALADAQTITIVDCSKELGVIPPANAQFGPDGGPFTIIGLMMGGCGGQAFISNGIVDSTQSETGNCGNRFVWRIEGYMPPLAPGQQVASAEWWISGQGSAACIGPDGNLWKFVNSFRASGQILQSRDPVSADSDSDGVLDGVDQCPDTASGAPVNAVGCTPDSDGDGVLDGVDQCPGTASGAPVNAVGCTPDSDGDGVIDSVDQCANTPAGAQVNAQGCVAFCKVPQIDEITDEFALIFEAAAHSGNRTVLDERPQQGLGPPTFSLFFPSVELNLDNAVYSLTSKIPGLTRSSGYRPFKYQQHLRQLRDLLEKYNKLSAEEKTDCAELKEELDTEIQSVHGLAMKNGLPQVNRPGTSLHNSVPSGAIDFPVKNWSEKDRKKLDLAADALGLIRSCPQDAVHYTLKGQDCTERIGGGAQSPVALLLIDPLGRRIGYDTTTGLVINEIGADASYSGLDSEPQLIEVAKAEKGLYVLKAVGTDSGPYTIFLQRETDDGELIERFTETGNASPGMVRELRAITPRLAEIWLKNSAAVASINSDSRGALPVALLSSPSFDATAEAVKSSITFGKTGAERSLAFCSGDSDVNLDGLLDAVCHFRLADTGIVEDDSQVVLRARLGNDVYQAVAVINTVPKK